MTLSVNVSGQIDATQLAALLTSTNVTVTAPAADAAPVIQPMSASTVLPLTAGHSTVIPMSEAEFGLCELDDTGAPVIAADKSPYGDVDYADPGYQEDKKKRYPVDTEKHIRAANSYIGQKGNAAKYSPEQVAHIKSKIASAWKAKIDKSGPPSMQAADRTDSTITDPSLGPVTSPNPDQIALSTEPTPAMKEHDGKIFWLLSDLAMQNWEGKECYEIPVAITGTWVKDGRRFSITDQDLDDMVKNFEGRGNGMVVVDYEHASEMGPEVSRGHEIPAAGWHYKLAKRQILNKQGKMLNALSALVEFTPKAKEMLANGEYKFFSPAIKFDKKDKESGEPIGAYLNSGALTNHPFLEDLPPIVLSDMLLTGLQNVHVGSTIPVGIDFQNGGLAVPAAGQVVAADNDKVAKKEKKMAKKMIKKVADGPDAGKFAMYSEDGQVVKTLSKRMSDQMESMSEKDREEMCTELCDMADMGMDGKTPVKLSEPEKQAGTGGTIVGSDVAPKPAPVVAAPVATPTPEVKVTMSEPVKTTAVLLSECITAEGRLDTEKVVNLAAEQKIKPEEAAKAVALNDTVAGLVQRGIFPPKQFGTAIGWALKDEAGFATFCATAKPQIDLSTRGVNLTDTRGNVAPNPAITDPNNKEAAFLKLTEDIYNANKANPTYKYEDAMKAASRQNPQLFDDYRNSTVNLSDRPQVAAMSLGDRPVLRNTYSPEVTARVSF